MIWSLAAGATVVAHADTKVDTPPDNTITSLLNAGSSSNVLNTIVVNAITGQVYETLPLDEVLQLVRVEPVRHGASSFTVRRMLMVCSTPLKQS